MAETLVTMAKGMKDKLVAGIIMQFARQDLAMQQIPFDDMASFVERAWQLTSHSEAVFRDIGEGYPDLQDTFDEIFNSVYLLGGKMDVDRALQLPKDKEIDSFNQNILLQSERFRTAFMDKFINGDRGTDPKAFNGLYKRMADLVALGHTDAEVDAQSGSGALDINASSANRQIFLDKMNEVKFNIAGGVADIGLTSKVGYLALTKVARREGLYDTTKDTFDKSVFTYDGTPIAWAGTLGDQSTEIIKSNETKSGGTGETSYVFLRWGEPYVHGLQMHAPERIFDDITDDGVTRRVVFEWPVGLSVLHRRSMVRLYGVIG